MKKRLFLLRHAKSSWKDLSLPDHDRPLNKRGRKAAAAMRRLVRSERISPDLICVSSALRTQQTLEALQPWEEPPEIKVEEALYLAPAPQLLERLRKIPDSTRAVLVIGHNPGLQELALLLVGGNDHLAEDALRRRLAESFPTGALAEFALDCSWARIGRGAGRLTRFVTPRELE
ncbi:histidine phosphatase family protein [Rhodoblastus sp. 17X3]|uniref:SixA phosphatase family protein n=1 Tax=Rhodoblastus sp. 17X3 TaxID=3047026 RepID=UPI0024B740A0|nr:histidine phosphatase family protein [Rhodoblastus sp. 17X3]MDI9848480.1 histidine phosphatase family protein [Rhodoblastus sp. 17X3]